MAAMHFTQEKMEIDEDKDKGCLESTRVCLKLSLVFMNIPIVVVGAVSLAVGVWVMVDDNSFFRLTTDILDMEILGKDILRQSAIVMITAGAAMLVLAGLGVVGALAMSSRILLFYVIPLIILLTLEVAVIVLAIVFKSEWETRAHNVLTEKLVSHYGDSVDNNRGPFTRTFDTLQQKLECCGWESSLDFEKVDSSHWNRSLPSGQQRKVPDSCCFSANSTWKHDCIVNPYNSSSFNTMGCKEAASKHFRRYQWIVIGVTIAVLTFQFILMILALVLIVNNVNNRYDMS